MIEETSRNGVETLLIVRRAEIETSMAQYLTGSAESEPSNEDIAAAKQLVDALIASFGDPGAAIGPPAVHAVAHRYYGLFGDGLSAVLKDVLGDAADTAFLSQAIDGYWRAVRAQAD